MEVAGHKEVAARIPVNNRTKWRRKAASMSNYPTTRVQCALAIVFPCARLLRIVLGDAGSSLH
jgi:uncharacterized protein (DUF927 family)